MAARVLQHFYKCDPVLHRVTTSSIVTRSCYLSQKQNFESSKSSSSNVKWAIALGLGGALTGYITYNHLNNKSLSDSSFLNLNPAHAKAEPIYNSTELKKHSTKESGIWVSYKDSVYDITEFVDSHPGGDKILLAAGGPIDPFWNMYAVHQTSEVLDILEQYKIGKLNQQDQVKVDFDDPFAMEPTRLPVFRINSKKPFNAEPPLQVLTDSFITPNELFYVRNHLPVPNVDLDNFKLKIVVGNRTLSLSVDELKKKYKPVTITTTIQCAGNRREEMSSYNTVKGLGWGTCAIGTARWTGVRLRDLLLDAGYDPTERKYKHIQFNGCDDDITKSCYGASIPTQKAMSLDGDVIIAYKMNGVDIPRISAPIVDNRRKNCADGVPSVNQPLRDHGFPLRSIVPGYVGARNVKWLHEIVASDEESTSHWQRNDYKGFSPNTTFETADYSKAKSIQEMPVVSAISSPQANSVVDCDVDGTIEVKGYAWSGGGRDIIRVDVSADGGKTWKEANLIKDDPDADDSAQSWAWTLWNVNLKVKKGEKHEITCKAIDSSYNTQPETVGPIWNLRGFLTNCWHRVPVEVANDD